MRRLAVSIVFVVISLALIFLFFTGKRTHRESRKVQCGGNLKILYGLTLTYSNKKGGGWFPFGPGRDPRAHQSLNLLVEYEGDTITPKLFVCHEGEAIAADVDPRTKLFRLSESNLDYAWTAEPLENNRQVAALASDKFVDGYRDSSGAHRGHQGGMNVLMSDGQLQFVEEKDLPSPDKLPAGLTR